MFFVIELIKLLYLDIMIKKLAKLVIISDNGSWSSISKKTKSNIILHFTFYVSLRIQNIRSECMDYLGA